MTKNGFAERTTSGLQLEASSSALRKKFSPCHGNQSWWAFPRILGVSLGEWAVYR
jgi:hypothetical protein